MRDLTVRPVMRLGVLLAALPLSLPVSASEQASASVITADTSPWARTLTHRVTGRWVVPEAPSPVACRAELRVMPDGTIFTLRVLPPCGTDIPARNSIERAIFASTPFPLPDDPADLRKLVLIDLQSDAAAGTPPVDPDGPVACPEDAMPALVLRPSMDALLATMARYTPSSDHEVVTARAKPEEFRTFASLSVEIDPSGVPVQAGFRKSTGNRDVDKALVAWTKSLRFEQDACTTFRLRHIALPFDLRDGADIAPGGP